MHALTRHLTMRRPQLRRLSVFAPLHKPFREFVDQHYHTVRAMLHGLLHEHAPLLQEVGSKYFKMALVTEVRTLLDVLDACYDAMTDAVYDALLSGDPQQTAAMRHVHQLLQQSFMGRSVHHWLHVPLLTLVDHCIDQLVPAPDVLGMNPRIRRYIKAAVRLVPACGTVDELLQRIGDTDWLLSSVAQPTDRIRKKLANAWHKRDVYYEALRSVLVIPHELVTCVRVEVAAQQRVDTCADAIHLLRARQARATRNSSTRKANGGKRHNSSIRRSRKASSKASRKATTLAYQPPTPLQAHERQKLHQLQLDHKRALHDLHRAEDTSATLVKWYRASARVARARTEQSAANTYQPSMLKRLWHKLRKTTPKPTAAQIQAADKVNAAKKKHAERTPQHAAFTSTARDTQHAKTTPPSMLLDFSPVHIVCAALSPLHVYHREFSGTLPFAALTYHLQTLDALVPVAYVPKTPDDDRYCRHVKDVPAFGLTDRQQACMRRSRSVRNKYCSVVYTLDDEEVFPRKTLMRIRGCDRCADVEACIERDRKRFKVLRGRCLGD